MTRKNYTLDIANRMVVRMDGLSQVTDRLLRRMVARIVAVVQPEQVILFGSRARGDARDDSDVDLVIVEALPFDATRSRREEAARIYTALAGFRVPKDILLYSRDEIERLGVSKTHVLSRALEEGKVMYERP